MPKILIAEEQPLIRQALRLLLERRGDEVVGQAADGVEAIGGVKALQPDLLLLALNLPRLSGLEVIQRLRSSGVPIRILVLSEHDAPRMIAACQRAGANGFVSKRNDWEDLSLAMAAVERGRTYFPESPSDVAVAPDASDASEIANLTPREMTVLTYLAKGLRVGQIAREMAISDRTVSTYKAHLLRKLNADSVVQLAEIAGQHGVGRQSPRLAHTEPAGSALDLALAGREILDAMPLALAIRDTDARLQFANAHYRAWLGDDASVFLAAGSDFQAECLGLDETDLDAVRTSFALAVKEGRSYRHEVMLRRNGHVSVKVNWGTPLRDEAGEVAAVLVGALDTTELEGAFLRLRDEKARVQAAIHAMTAVVCCYLERIERMLAEVDAGIGSDAMAAVAELRALVPTLSGPTRAPKPCVLAEAITVAFAKVGVASASRNVRFQLHLADAGQNAALVDPERLSQMVTALARAAICALCDAEVIVTLRAMPLRRGLVDVALDLRSDAIWQPNAPQGNVAVAELQLCRRLADLTGATLTASTEGEPFAVALHAVVPRADAAPAA